MSVSGSTATLIAGVPSALATWLAFRQRGTRRSALEKLVADLTETIGKQFRDEITYLRAALERCQKSKGGDRE